MQTDLNAGRVKVVRGNPILEEWAVLQWADNKAPSDKRQEDPRLSNHLSDAGLYAWREARHWLYEAPPPIIVEKTPEYYKAEEEKIIRRREEQLKRKKEWWEE